MNLADPQHHPRTQPGPLKESDARRQGRVLPGGIDAGLCGASTGGGMGYLGPTGSLMTGCRSDPACFVDIDIDIDIDRVYGTADVLRTAHIRASRA